MPVCGKPEDGDCAHEATKALKNLNIIDLRNKPKLYGCLICKFSIRAH
jgi:hypothetical protein